MINEEAQRTMPIACGTFTQANAAHVFPISYPQRLCVHHVFEARVASEPDALALKCADARYTYRELNRRANQLAHHLISRGVRPGALVGVFLERSPELVICVLAILKAGGAYVPCDPSYPRERVARMLQGITLSHLLTTSSLVSRIPPSDLALIVLDQDRAALSFEGIDNPSVEITPDDLAYVIFTSGSTGDPKATAVHHAGWRNLLNWFTSEFSITSRDKVLVVSSFGFDITQRALAMPLVSGGELHLLASSHFSPDLVLSTVDADESTLMNCAPSPFYTLFENRAPADLRKLRSLRTVFLGGEPISGSRLKPWHDSPHCRAELVNVYGIAECADVSTFHRLRDFAHYLSNAVPIGKPIFETRIHLLDDALAPVRDGDVGEICIAGTGIGKGYLNDPRLTARKFISGKCVNEKAQLYRTGDLGRLRADGNLEFVGRVDHQVKLHGVRIELEEIESALRQHPDVQEAVALVKHVSRNDPVLVACILPGQHSTEEQWPGLLESVRQHLRATLPQNMMPHIFVRLTEVPLNPNGKTDRKALEARDVDARAPAPDERKRTSVEVVVGAFVAEALGVPSVGLDADFFDLGGHSVMAIQVVTRINELFETQLDISLFSGERSTVSTLAARVNETLKPNPAH